MRSNNFTLMRLIFAVMVIYSHSHAIIDITEPVIFARTAGAFAVQSFFAISGYLVCGSFLTTAPAGYLARRIARVFPALIVAYAFSMWAFDYFGGYPRNALHESNGPLWTITWEVLLYILLFFVGILGLLNRSAMGGAYLACIVIFLVTLDPAAPQAMMVGLFLLFGGGAFLRLNEDSIDMRLCGGIAISALVLLYVSPAKEALFLLISAIPFVFGSSLHFDHLQWAVSLIALPYALLLLARYFPVSLPLRNDYSYGVYLFAWPIQQITVHAAAYYGYPLTPLKVFAVALPLSLLCGALSWHLVERHAIRLGHTRWRDLSPRRALAASKNAMRKF